MRCIGSRVCSRWRSSNGRFVSDVCRSVEARTHAQEMQLLNCLIDPTRSPFIIDARTGACGTCWAAGGCRSCFSQPPQPPSGQRPVAAVAVSFYNAPCGYVHTHVCMQPQRAVNCVHSIELITEFLHAWPHSVGLYKASRQQRPFAIVMQSASLATKGVNLYVYDHCPFCVRGKPSPSVSQIS